MNKIIIKGRLTRDPEMRASASGVEFCKFTVAVDRRVSKDKMKEKQADFFDCVAFSGTAGMINAYFHKGKEILVEGRMESNTTEKDGQKRTYWNVTVENAYFCGNKSDSAPAVAAVPQQAEPVEVTPPEELPF